MNRFCRENARDLWRIITDKGELTGRPSIYGNKAEFDLEDYSVRSETVRNRFGIMSRADTLISGGKGPVHFYAMDMRFVLEGDEYEVYTQFNAWQNESTGGWQPLVTEIGASSPSVRTSSGAAPMLALWNRQTNRGIVFHYIPDGAWRMSARRVPRDGDGEHNQVVVEMGPDYCGLDMEVENGNAFTLPEVWFYDFSDKVSMDSWRLHEYCSMRFPRRSLPVMYNTWMGFFDRVDFDTVARQIPLAAELGVEYFILDAGWFGNHDDWVRSLGDWTESRRKRYGGRLLELTELIRSHGMKVGLWFEPERAYAESKTHLKYPSYYMPGTTEDHYFLDFADPKAREFMVKTVIKAIEKYHVEFVKLDLNADLYFDPRRRAFIEYYKGLYYFIGRIRETFPGIYIENCASGGGRLNLGSYRVFDSIWYSDCQSPYEGMRIIKDSLRRLPPQIFDRWFVGHSVEVFGAGEKREKLLFSEDARWEHVAGVNTSFLEAFMCAGPIGISCDLAGISQSTFAWLKKHIENYKRDRDFWRFARCTVLTDTESMLVLQYNDMRYRLVRIQIISLRSTQAEIRVYPRLPDEDQFIIEYGFRVPGGQLNAQGIAVKKKTKFFSDSWTMQEIIIKKVEEEEPAVELKRIEQPRKMRPFPFFGGE